MVGNTRLASWKLSFLIVFLGLFLDQLTKQLIRLNAWSFSTSFVDSTLMYNTGTLWSLFAGNSANIFFIVLSIVILTGIAVFAYKEPQYKPYLALVFAAGLGNLIDRILFGGVIDFINLGWWPVFNVADSLLVLGVGALITVLIKEEFTKQSHKLTN